MKSQLHRAASWYAKHGWFVVPLHTPRFDEEETCIGCTCELYWRKKSPGYTCLTPGKHPRISDWEEEATTDIHKVNNWWSRWPDANVGIAAGKSGLLVLDADNYKDNYAGEHLLTLEDEQTITNLTGSGGNHLVYRMPEGAFFTNSRGDLPTGIDIRGWGGQFVAPPSFHPSGRQYTWESGFGPHEIEPLPLPDHITAILEACHSATKTPVIFADDCQPKPDLSQWRVSKKILELIHSPVAQGGRSEADQSVITALVRRGATDDQIRAVFEHYPIGTEGKFADKGRYGLRYLANSIAHARGWYAQKRTEEVEQRASNLLRMAAR